MRNRNSAVDACSLFLLDVILYRIVGCSGNSQFYFLHISDNVFDAVDSVRRWGELMQMVSITDLEKAPIFGLKVQWFLTKSKKLLARRRSDIRRL